MSRHPVGHHLVPVDLPGAVAGLHPRLVLHHPASVQRLHQGARPRRRGTAQADPAAQDMRRKHDRHEAGLRRLSERHEDRAGLSSKLTRLRSV